MKRPRKIAVLTTSRADYGLLYWLMRAVHGSRDLRLQLMACGSHLGRAFGGSIRQIREDGLPIAAELDTLPRREDGAGLARAIGLGTARFGEAFSRLRPDLLVVLGDRYELLCAACAAVAARLPIAHIHGGESTEGVLDEQVRHALTKLSHIHFTAAELYRRRVIQMGEDPRRVFNVGALGLESIRRLSPVPRPELERRLRFDLGSDFILATYHPDSLSEGLGAGNVNTLLDALQRARLRAVFTYANADAGGREINRKLRAFAARRPGSAAVVPTLGQDGWLSLMRLAKAVVGNSSSGIIEAPSLKVPTVNIGDRQRGRLRSPSILDCEPSAPAILKALRLALSPAFRRRCTGKNAYGTGESARLMLGVLKAVPLGEELLKKSFYDR